jgi:putative acetyltransferase
VPADDPVVAVLAAAQQAELDTMNPPDHVPYPLRVDISFVLVSVDGTPSACGALQRLNTTTGEIKRMYVVPAARRTGLSRVVLSELEARGRELGLRTLRLETAEMFTAAVALYRSYGYRPIPPFGDYVGDPLSYCMERDLPSE